MTALLYVYKHTPDDGVELKHSLRSVAQHFHPKDGDLDLTVVGDRPSWLSEGYHMTGNPTKDCKAYNVAYNVYKACQALLDEDIPTAVFCSDDYFLLEHVTSIAQGHRTFSIDEHAVKTGREEPGSNYDRGIRATAVYVNNRRSSHNLNDRSWELHRPFPINCLAVINALKPIVEAEPQPIMPWWRTVYGTTIPRSEMGWPMDDPWVAKGYPPRGNSWISLGDGAWEHFGKTLSKQFSTPSPWEMR